MSEANKRPEGGPKAAVIGLGGMGRRHVAALDSLGIPVVGLCDMISAASTTVVLSPRVMTFLVIQSRTSIGGLPEF